MLHLLLGRDWTANRQEILNRISWDVRQRLEGRILMVPELISHETERRLAAAAGDTASRYAEVLSFTRLARRVADDLGSATQECLDNGGRLVAMAATARQLSSRLKAYASVETKPEFLSGLIDAVDEFKRCCITPGDLACAAKQTEGNLAQKLEELSLLMEGYDALCAQGKRDPRDQMTWLLEHLEMGTFGQNHVFYIDGFPDFTRQNMAILQYLIQVSPDVTVSLNCDRPETDRLAFEKAAQTARELIRCARKQEVAVEIEYITPPAMPVSLVREKLYQGGIEEGCAGEVLKVYHAESVWQECMGAAQRVMELVRSGCRYRDIALVCTDMAEYGSLVDLIFQRFHIPIYQSGTENILQKSILNTVLTALDAALGGFEQRDTFRYLRSPMCPLSLDACDLVENYAILWGIRGQRWEQDWQLHPDGLGAEFDEESRQRLEALNAARKQVMDPLIRMRQGFRDAKNLRQQVTALYGFLEELDMESLLTELADELDDLGDNREAQILNQLWEILLSALEQMYDVLGNTHWDAEHFTRLLRLLLSQYDVGTIPPVLDAVQMGPVSAMRCNQQKHLILLGAKEGSLPGYSGSNGVLTDQERVTLRKLGVPLTGGAMEGIQAEFAEIYGVFCGAMESIRVFYSGEQPSFVFQRLTRLAGGVSELPDGMDFAQADPWEAGAWLAQWPAQTPAEILGAMDGYTEVSARRNYGLGRIEKETVRKLYGSILNLSASQIDRQAECRLSYFLKYGLRAQERKEAAIDPAEFGIYVHWVLEQTARQIRDKGGFPQVSLEETLEIAHRYSEEYAAKRFSQIESERMTYLFRRNIRELDMVVQELWEELRRSLFQPRDFEVNFGGEDGLPPIDIANDAMKAILRGFVDRVDVWHRQGTDYYRVVDYKTGSKDFDYCDVFNGVGLQMLLYLFALKHDGQSLLGGNPIPTGVLYFPARAPYLSADGKLTPEEAEQARQSQWKRKGLLLRDEEVLQAMEPGESPQRMCYSVKKDGSLSGDLADRDQLKLLERYVFHILADMVEEIASGNISPNPYTRGSSHDACAYCPYGPICHETAQQGRRNYKAMKPERFWDEIRKEMEPNGR